MSMVKVNSQPATGKVYHPNVPFALERILIAMEMVAFR